MLTHQLCSSGMGSNEQGVYCSSMFCSDLDRLNHSIDYLLYFYQAVGKSLVYCGVI